MEKNLEQHTSVLDCPSSYVQREFAVRVQLDTVKDYIEKREQHPPEKFEQLTSRITWLREQREQYGEDIIDKGLHNVGLSGVTWEKY